MERIHLPLEGHIHFPLEVKIHFPLYGQIPFFLKGQNRPEQRSDQVQNLLQLEEKIAKRVHFFPTRISVVPLVSPKLFPRPLELQTYIPLTEQEEEKKRWTSDCLVGGADLVIVGGCWDE